MTPPRVRRVLDVSSHGNYGYSQGCRCDECYGAKAAGSQRCYLRKRGYLPPAEPTPRIHGSISSYHSGCRCEACRRIGREHRARFRARQRRNDPRATESCPMCGEWFVSVAHHEPFCRRAA